MATVGTAPTSTDNADIRAEGQAAIVGRSPSELFWRRFRRDKFAVGVYRGKVDTVISRLIDVVLSLPVLLLALGLVSACGLSDTGCLGGFIKPGLLLVAYVIGLFSWPYIARIVRGQVLSLREKEFIEAARATGSSNARIMLREILPNIVAPIIVYTTLLI